MEGLVELAGAFADHRHGREQALGRQQAPGARRRGLDIADQMSVLAANGLEEIGTELIVRRAAEKIVIADPGRQPRAENIRTPQQRIPFVMPGQPAIDQISGAQPGRLAAKVAQIAQPAKAVQMFQRAGLSRLLDPRIRFKGKAAVRIGHAPVQDRTPDRGIPRQIVRKPVIEPEQWFRRKAPAINRRGEIKLL